MHPGEISLAHGGVLFLDELGEFAPKVLDALRQPLEDGTVQISRVAGSADYPARVLLVAAMNPCPCGGSGAPGGCRCPEHVRLKYLRRVSGPLLDRFDLRIDVDRRDAERLDRLGPGKVQQRGSRNVKTGVPQDVQRLSPRRRGLVVIGGQVRRLEEHGPQLVFYIVLLCR